MSSLMINHNVSYFLNIAVFALAFLAIVLWLGQSELIVYGLITFIYAIGGHVMDNAFNLIYGKYDENKDKYCLPAKSRRHFAIVSIVLFLGWLLSILIMLF